MKLTGFCLGAVLMGVLGAGVPVQGSANLQQGSNDDSSLLGDWHGESVCVVRESACRDEESLYHISRLIEKPGWFSVMGDKIVDGKAVSMGTVECRYESDKQTLSCESPRGVFKFTVKNSRMIGTMNLPDGSLWRKISLSRVNPKRGE
jgi:hypothetical protein